MVSVMSKKTLPLQNNPERLFGIPRHCMAPWRAVSRDTRGGVAILFAFALVPLICFIGIGFDSARAYMVKSRLSSALDAAALAGGASFFLPQRDDDIEMYFNANYPSGYLGSVIDGPDITVNDAEETIELAANATLDTTLLRVIGKDSITVSAKTEVTRKMTALDVVLSIDVSGSMGWSAPGGGSRIQAAKNAANELIRILFGVDSSEEYLHIGLVPWSSKVNVMTEGESYNAGGTTTKAVPGFQNPDTGEYSSVVHYANNSQVPLLTAPPAGWRGCVFNRYTHNGNNQDDGDIRYGAYSGGGGNWPGWQPIFAGDHETWGGEPVPGWQKCNMSINNEECTACPRRGITPLQNKKAKIKRAVNDLTAGGNTNIPAGLGWAWRVLKPDAPFTDAINNPDYKREQAIVLLTDGENCGKSGDGYRSVFGNCSGGRDEMNNRLKKLAYNVKSDGVILYVIQFANEGTELQSLLKEIASGPESPYYHYAPTSDALKLVFRNIANHLSSLRLSK